jgi:hypothetical protein
MWRFAVALKNEEGIRDCAERSCERLKLLTKLNYELITSDGHIILVGGGRAAGYWTNWQDAKLSLATCVQIVEDAFLEIVLFGDNCKSTTHLSKIELELADAKELVEIQALELKIMKRAVRYYTREAKKNGN